MKFMSISGSGSGRILGSRIPDIRPDIQGGGAKKTFISVLLCGTQEAKGFEIQFVYNC